MNETRPPHYGTAPAPSLNLGDILYILFRHKWLVGGIALAAIVVTVCLPLVMPVQYRSDARLIIRYVMDNRAPTPDVANDPRIKTPDNRGDTIINNELQILTSRDLAQRAAVAVGPEKLLGKKATTNSVAEAAALVQKDLIADVQKNSSVIQIGFQHKDPEVVQAVLRELISAYYKQHPQIHGGGAFNEFLTQETDQRRSRLAETERELREALASAGVISLSESRQTYASEISHLQDQLLESEAELAQQRATVNEMAKVFQPVLPGGAQTNAAAATNTVPMATPPEIVSQYRRVSGEVDNLLKRAQEMSLIYTASNRMMMEVREQLAAAEKSKTDLETRNPGLLSVPATTASGLASGDGGTVQRQTTLAAETARAIGMESKVQILRSQLTNVVAKAGALAQAEEKITELQRRKNLLETNYALFAMSLDRAQIDERIGEGKVSNIITIQEPTPPAPVPGKTLKAMALVFFGGIALALALAFVLEMYVDGTVKRPVDIETKLGLPLFMSIPALGDRALLNGKHTALLTEGKADGGPVVSGPVASGPPSALDVPSWDPHLGFRPFSEALRDRLITFFEIKQMTHKPKLVAVTSCGEGAGVSTVSAGLAAALSETGDGNVLLVDMNGQNGAAHHFFKGDLDGGIDAALESGKRDQALVQENLYVVSETQSGNGLPTVLPKRFKHLVPKLKASDYDYIIFDMPPVSQISLTPRLSKFMDMVLMVVASEETHRDVVKRATSLLRETQPNVGVVLNQVRTYVPKALKQEL